MNMTGKLNHSPPKPRPALFLALGKESPPECIVIEGEEYFRKEIFKHDSWAATAMYESGGKKIVCKFNRRESIFGFPMGWLGRFLARREAFFFNLLADMPCVPQGYDTVRVQETVQANAYAHHYVEGAPMKRGAGLPSSFFDDLEAQIAEIHRRGVAYMDLHKPENIILGSDGRPYLVDFQVTVFVRPDSWFWPARYMLRLFQRADEYHILKHRYRSGRSEDLIGWDIRDYNRPFWIRVHRFFAIPLRKLRRKLLVLLGIRRGDGKVHTELFVEHGLRTEPNHADEADSTEGTTRQDIVQGRFDNQENKQKHSA